MGKVDELMRTAGGNIDESMGRGRSTADHPGDLGCSGPVAGGREGEGCRPDPGG